MKPMPAATAPPDEIAAFLIDAALKAPSVHNTQPWWFGVRGSRVSLHADLERRLEVADPHGREMLISCGAALYTLRLAARHLGRVPKVRILPDSERPMLLADVDFSQRQPPTRDEERLFDEVDHRRTHRGGFRAERPLTALLPKLSIEARREGASLRIVTDPRARYALGALSEAAEQTQRIDVHYLAEVARWAPAPGSARNDGIHSDTYPRALEHVHRDFAARDFARGQGWGRPGDGRDNRTGVVALLMTVRDMPRDWLKAGQALQRLLLSAARTNVSAAFHTQVLELPELRDFVQARFCGGDHPQLLMRLGQVADHPDTGVRRRHTEIAKEEV
jgi:nitroreductase